MSYLQVIERKNAPKFSRRGLILERSGSDDGSELMILLFESICKKWIEGYLL
jgi:hypothetical protein